MITCPAPNAGVARDAADVREALTERIRRILYVFKMHKHTSLVLGAFGCGVFKNDPFEVAVIFRQYLESTEFSDCFQRVVFAVLDENMCRIFYQVFESTDLNAIQQQLRMGSLRDARHHHHQYSSTHRNTKSATSKRRSDIRVDQTANDHQNYLDE